MLSSDELDPLGLEGTPASVLSEPDTPETKALLALWKSKCVDGRLPYRSDFSPSEMKDYLDHIYIIEALDGGADFQVRLVGTALEGLFGHDFTGVKFSDDRMKGAEWRLRLFRHVIDTKEAGIYRFLIGPSEQRQAMTENLMLPVLDRSDEHMVLLGLSVLIGRYDAAGNLVEVHR